MSQNTTHPVERKLLMKHLTHTLFIAIVCQNEVVSEDSKNLALRISSMMDEHDVELCQRRAMGRVRSFQKKECELRANC
jgi:hypothetical protein